jgi:predicted DNA-binding ribbon-helix-helix protein
MKSLVIKRSIVVAGHKTSIAIEDAFWKALKDIAAARGVTLSDLVTRIDAERRHDNLSSAIRVFILEYFRGRTHPARDQASSRPELSVLRTD